MSLFEVAAIVVGIPLAMGVFVGLLCLMDWACPMGGPSTRQYYIDKHRAQRKKTDEATARRELARRTV